MQSTTRIERVSNVAVGVPKGRKKNVRNFGKKPHDTPHTKDLREFTAVHDSLPVFLYPKRLAL